MFLRYALSMQALVASGFTMGPARAFNFDLLASASLALGLQYIPQLHFRHGALPQQKKP